MSARSQQQKQRARAGLRKLAVAAIVGTLALIAPLALALDATVTAAGLPAQARQTLTLIRHGGPFPFAKDGIVFGNYEHLLPQHTRGYYHEYTVPAGHRRGAVRIVCGGHPTSPDICYYSHDHYASFQRIVP